MSVTSAPIFNFGAAQPAAAALAANVKKKSSTASNISPPPNSPLFACSDFNITLISCDGFRLPANTVNLRASSSVFRDMLDLGCKTTEKAEVTLVEAGEDVEWVVRYSHLMRVPKFVLNFPACLSTIKALHKYGIWRGLEAVTAAFHQSDLNHSLNRTSYELSTSFHAYTFAILVEENFLAERALKQMSGLTFDWEELVSLSKGDTCDFSAGRDLVVSWADNRISAQEAFAKATAQLMSHLGAPHSASRTSSVEYGRQFSALRLWGNLISVNTVLGLDTKLLKEPIMSRSYLRASTVKRDAIPRQLRFVRPFRSCLSWGRPALLSDLLCESTSAEQVPRN